MGYKPQIKQQAGFGPQGVATVEVNPKDRNQIRYILTVEKRENGNVTTEERKGKVNRSDCPDDVAKMIQPGKWFISVNNDGNKIYGFRPVEGMFEVVVDRFSAPDGKLPEPKEFHGSGKTGPYSYKYFTVILRIVSGEAQGMKIPYTLRYEFEPGQEEVQGKMRDVVALSITPKSKYFAPLVDFMDAAGVWVKGPMPYKENILPTMEARIKEQGRKFKVMVVKGQVIAITGGMAEFASEFEPTVEK